MRLNRASITRAGVALLAVALLAGYWLLPIEGQVVILSGPPRGVEGLWPQIWADPPLARPGEPVAVYVRDTAPWPYVLLTVNGATVPRDESLPFGGGPWTWRWRFTMPQQAAELRFFHDCHTGCVERGRAALGVPAGPPAEPRSPTKLGAVFADPERDWHGRQAWTVLLTYVQRQDNADFGLDGLAHWVRRSEARGLRVLVRVAYDYQQALPPAGDEVALLAFLEYYARLARDARLAGVHGFVVGAGFNGRGENMLAPDRPTTPEWYARVFGGYGVAPERSDNVAQIIHGINPQARVLVGSVAPWETWQSGALPDPLDRPWLNYANTLVARLDEAARAKAKQGRQGAAPDGFALNAPGRPGHAQVAAPAQEPAADLRPADQGGAQTGFRVYRDWLAVINRHPTTRGLPAYITATNTFTEGDATLPAQNYPPGWLTAALREIDAEPQVRALCWFVDLALGDRWQPYSLRQRAGRLNDAAAEFDRLLRE